VPHSCPFAFVSIRVRVCSRLRPFAFMSVRVRVGVLFLAACGLAGVRVLPGVCSLLFVFVPAVPFLALLGMGLGDGVCRWRLLL
jgi:hypothetical protein